MSQVALSIRKLVFIHIQVQAHTHKYTHMFNNTNTVKHITWPMLLCPCANTMLAHGQPCIFTRTFGAITVNIFAKITWPVSAKRIWLRNVENHITHSKSATSCGKGRHVLKNTWHELEQNSRHKWATYHFPAKIMPSWSHTLFEGFSLYILWMWKETQQKGRLQSKM